MLEENDFKSIFKDEFYSFIQYKRSLGYDYIREECHLKKIDLLITNLGLKSKVITKDIFYELVKKNNKTEHSYISNYRLVVNFLKYLVDNGYKNIYYESKKFHKINNFIPIIFSKKEIFTLFKIMDENTKTCSPSFYKRNYTYSIVFRLIYSCGLRISEALDLKVKDINLEENIINIIDSKNHVSRVIVCSESMKICLTNYIKKYNISDGLLFLNKKNKRIVRQTIMDYYKKVLVVASLNTKARIQDLRHCFANDALNQMLEKGYDENVVIVYLQKYLGHKSIKETERYLHFTDYNKQKIINNNDSFSKYLYEGINLNEK